MLPKKAYSKVIQGLKRIKKNWDADRIENPSKVPYEIDIELKMLIEQCTREAGVYCNNRDRETLIQATCAYLIKVGQITGSPYGGYMFPLPEDHASLPTKVDFIEQVKKDMNKLGF